MSRAPRTTKKQKECLINYFETHKILLGSKMNPMYLPKVNKMWEEVASQLNSIGPGKTVRQWKDTISEMKTSVRRRARDVKYGHTGTGGGSSIKPLTDFEERLLALISTLTIEGANLVEAGGDITPLKEIEEVEILYDTHAQGGSSSFIDTPPIDSNEMVMEEVPHEGNDFSIPQINELKENRFKERSGNRHERQRPPRRNKNRVYSALDIHDKNLHALTMSNYAIAKAINNLAKSINNISRKWK